MKLRFKLIFSITFLSFFFCSFPPQISARFLSKTDSIRSDFQLKPPNFTTSAWDSFRSLSGSHAGEIIPGLSKLKHYFRHFGYLPDPAVNFTDSFDDSLESAVRTYQRNFNLNVTGQLDQRTIRQIVLPRCGDADVVNGSTTMRPPSNGGSTTKRYSFFPGRPRWPGNRRNLSYAFLPDNKLSKEVKEVFAAAFKRWSEAAAGTVTFKETEDYIGADVRVGFLRGPHGDGDPFDGVFGTLAHAFSPPNGRLHLDGDEDWVVSGFGDGLPTAVDLETVAVHEIGHLLGLGHSSDPEAIMYPTITSMTRKVELAQDDIDGLRQLYGGDASWNGTSSPSVQARETSGGTYVVGVKRSGMDLFVAVGLALLFL
ncbi:Metalloendoproteinase 5-MMP [Linum grandiflorum]